MESTEDQVCIARIKQGDPAHYTYIVDKYKHMAYTIALKILNNKDDANDVAQESFIKAYQQISQFEGKSKFSTWLYTIVYRTAISKWNENKIETQSIDENVRENYPHDKTSHPHEQLLRKEEQIHVKHAIQKLPKTEALLVTLFYINESSLREIHAITGLSLPNIKIKLFRARKKLERELQFLIHPETETIVGNEKE